MSYRLNYIDRARFSGSRWFCNLSARRVGNPGQVEVITWPPFHSWWYFKHVWGLPEHRLKAAASARGVLSAGPWTEQVYCSLNLFSPPPLLSKVCWDWMGPPFRGSVWGPSKSSLSFDRVYSGVFLIILDVLPIIPLASSEDRDK